MKLESQVASLESICAVMNHSTLRSLRREMSSLSEASVLSRSIVAVGVPDVPNPPPGCRRYLESSS